MQDDRRTVMKAAGGLAALGAFRTQFDWWNKSTSGGVRQGEQVLTITAPYGHTMYYQFVLSASIRKLDHDPYGSVPSGAVTVDGEDDIKGCLCHGATNGGADVYAISGDLTYANLSGTGARDGTGRVYLDGADITTAFERGTPPASDTDTDCGEPTTEEPTTTPEPPTPSTVVCDARRATSQVEITIQVTEQVVHKGDASQGLTIIVNPGDRVEIPFAGALLCFAVQGGDADVHIRYRDAR